MNLLFTKDFIHEITEFHVYEVSCGKENLLYNSDNFKPTFK